MQNMLHDLATFKRRAASCFSYRRSSSAIIAFCCVLTQSVSAQHLGFTTSYAGNWRAINHQIEQYNRARPWLDQEMKPFTTLMGFDVGYGIHEWDEPFGLDLMRWKWSRATTTASFGDESRELRIKLGTFSFSGFAYYLVRSEKFRLGIGLYPIELSRSKITSRMSGGDWEELYKATTIFGFPTDASSTVYLTFQLRTTEKLALQARLFYELHWFDGEEIIPVAKALNPATFEVNHQTQTLVYNHVGLQLLLNLTR